MDIREFRSFIHVARAGSFSNAAADLHIAQPALSRQIAKLEGELGVELLIRHGRGVRLTGAGARLLERAEAILQMVSETGEQVRASAHEERGTVSIGLPPALGLLVGADLISSCKARWPRVSIHMREGLSSSLQEWLIDRRVDLALVYNQPLLDIFDVEPLFSEAMVLAGPPEDGTIGETLHIRDLNEIPLILPSFPHTNRRLVEQAAIQHGVRLRIALEVESVPLTKCLVKSGMGYAILSPMALQSEIARNELIVHRIERPSLRSTLAITTLRQNRSSNLINSLANVLRERLRQLTTSVDGSADITWLKEGIYADQA